VLCCEGATDDAWSRRQDRYTHLPILSFLGSQFPTVSSETEAEIQCVGQSRRRERWIEPFL
jgi:hypothetical protein